MKRYLRVFIIGSRIYPEISKMAFESQINLNLPFSRCILLSALSKIFQNVQSFQLSPPYEHLQFPSSNMRRVHIQRNLHSLRIPFPSTDQGKVA